MARLQARIEKLEHGAGGVGRLLWLDYLYTGETVTGVMLAGKAVQRLPMETIEALETRAIALAEPTQNDSIAHWKH
jgi:hypothetical protein